MKKEINLEEAFEKGYFHDIYVEALRLKSALETAKNALEFYANWKETVIDGDLVCVGTVRAEEALAKIGE